MNEEREALFRRFEDLRQRCERSGSVTSLPFLTPAEQFELKNRPAGDTKLLFTGGAEGCERQCAFFLPWYMEESDFDPAEYIRCIRVQSYFGTPGHRDYMGAVLGLGIRREWLGDIRVEGDKAWIFCLESVAETICSLEKAGRVSVKAQSVPLSAVPPQEQKVKAVHFTVKSLRLDAVTGEMFSLSRTAAAEKIRLGEVTLNYSPELRVDAPVKEGDVISLHGHGKGSVTEIGGKSRKDRLFVTAELRL